MLKQNLAKYCMRHPATMDVLKTILSSKPLCNNKIYQKYTLHRANQHNSKHPQDVRGVAIETTLDCNARCVMCAHSRKEMFGTMPMELFEKIIDDCVKNNITNIGLSVYGEPLMDKHFFDRVRYLRKYNMNYGFFTNGYLLNSSKVQMLFDLGGLAKINFSVCGYSKNVYENTMVGLKRDITYKNILNFLQAKQNQRNKPIVVISTVKTFSTMKDKDMEKFIRFWQRQKWVDFIITANLWDRMGKENIDDSVGKIGKMIRRDTWLPPCKELWGCVYVYFDGKVTPCCADNDNRELIIGDMNKQTLEDVYSSDIFMNLRHLHLDNKRNRHKICSHCFRNTPWI